MPEFIAHELMQHADLKRWLVFKNEDVLKNYGVVFGTQGMANLKKATLLVPGDFYEIKRYFQFVGLVSYHKDMGMLTMSLFESENMDTFLDAFMDMRVQDWKDSDINQIGVITQAIIDDKNKELATIKLEKVL